MRESARADIVDSCSRSAPIQQSPSCENLFPNIFITDAQKLWHSDLSLIEGHQGAD
jgi:hypothetical protein